MSLHTDSKVYHHFRSIGAAPKCESPASHPLGPMFVLHEANSLDDHF